MSLISLRLRSVQLKKTITKEKKKKKTDRDQATNQRGESLRRSNEGTAIPIRS